MTNNQANNPNEDPNQLSDNELNAVAGGGIIGDAINAVKDKAKDVAADVKDVIVDHFPRLKKF